MFIKYKQEQTKWILFSQLKCIYIVDGPYERPQTRDTKNERNDMSKRVLFCINHLNQQWSE